MSEIDASSPQLPDRVAGLSAYLMMGSAVGGLVALGVAVVSWFAGWEVTSAAMNLFVASGVACMLMASVMEIFANDSWWDRYLGVGLLLLMGPWALEDLELFALWRGELVPGWLGVVYVASHAAWISVGIVRFLLGRMAPRLEGDGESLVDRAP